MLTDMHRFLLLCLASALTAGPAAAFDVSSVPRPPAGRWSVDTTGKIRSDTLAELDRIAGEVDASGKGQLAVVVVPSTRGAPPRSVATRLFNHWGIGHHSRDDGVLLFVALQDRKAEIVLGDGVDDTNDVRRSDEVMASAVVANFKRGNPDEALLAGARGLVRLLEQSWINAGAQSAPAVVELKSPRPHGWTVQLGVTLSPSTVSELNRLADDLYSTGEGKLFFVAFDGANGELVASTVVDAAEHAFGVRSGERTFIVATSVNSDSSLIWSPILSQHSDASTEHLRELTRHLEDAARRGDAENGLIEAGAAVVSFARIGVPPRPVGQQISRVVDRNPMGTFLFSGGFLLGGFVFVRGWLRNRPRRCDKCQRQRVRLEEERDDVHLDAGQQTEERIKSADYDVWWCDFCDDALVLRYSMFFSGAARCTSCQYVTARQTTRTIVHATYDHGGQVEVTERCVHCSHVRVYTRYTARLTRSSSSSSSSRSSSSSSSSFGGGRSSGGGSSGSW
ncbi:MAG TPA: TPM domain-containing protein [Myxococcaceae bacterium]|nr:TPM domain-containing protein [Myxococcaceae bacterium]